MAVIKQRKQFTTHLLSWFKSRKSESVSTSEESEAEMKPTEEEQDVVFSTACMWHTTLHIHQVLQRLLYISEDNYVFLLHYIYLVAANVYFAYSGFYCRDKMSSKNIPMSSDLVV